MIMNKPVDMKEFVQTEIERIKTEHEKIITGWTNTELTDKNITHIFNLFKRCNAPEIQIFEEVNFLGRDERRINYELAAKKLEVTKTQTGNAQGKSTRKSNKKKNKNKQNPLESKPANSESNSSPIVVEKPIAVDNTSEERSELEVQEISSAETKASEFAAINLSTEIENFDTATILNSTDESKTPTVSRVDSTTDEAGTEELARISSSPVDSNNLDLVVEDKSTDELKVPNSAGIDNSTTLIEAPESAVTDEAPISKLISYAAAVRKSTELLGIENATTKLTSKPETKIFVESNYFDKSEEEEEKISSADESPEVIDKPSTELKNSDSLAIENTVDETSKTSETDNLEAAPETPESEVTDNATAEIKTQDSTKIDNSTSKVKSDNGNILPTETELPQTQQNDKIPSSDESPEMAVIDSLLAKLETPELAVTDNLTSDLDTKSPAKTDCFKQPEDDKTANIDEETPSPQETTSSVEPEKSEVNEKPSTEEKPKNKANPFDNEHLFIEPLLSRTSNTKEAEPPNALANVLGNDYKSQESSQLKSNLQKLASDITNEEQHIRERIQAGESGTVDNATLEDFISRANVVLKETEAVTVRKIAEAETRKFLTSLKIPTGNALEKISNELMQDIWPKSNRWRSIARERYDDAPLDEVDLKAKRKQDEQVEREIKAAIKTAGEPLSKKQIGQVRKASIVYRDFDMEEQRETNYRDEQVVKLVELISVYEASKKMDDLMCLRLAIAFCTKRRDYFLKARPPNFMQFSYMYIYFLEKLNSTTASICACLNFQSSASGDFAELEELMLNLFHEDFFLDEK